MPAKEEVGENCAPFVHNVSASRINESALQLYPVSKYDMAKYLKFEFPGMEINQLLTSFSWVIPLKQLPNSRV
ncbi:hypothetical protein H5410_030763 [Solanum commersonii]|uniref:Uncharacterized protein n=1 Tax=Solanum commersonii TaxID=4109 RepID=A0A9J5YGM8_SOLCO|nr:hypothetical protein H5410_030763 [Solanum commersonii]